MKRQTGKVAISIDKFLQKEFIDKKIKTSMYLSKGILDFYRDYAPSINCKYQQLIRCVLGEYAKQVKVKLNDKKSSKNSSSKNEF
jgi:hypothetical protein